MTGGDKENTEAWVRKRGVKYPFAYDHQFELAGPFNVFGLPHAILVDPAGLVVYNGHPRGVTEDLIRRHLEGAIDKPLFLWPEAAAPVRTALLRGEFAEAVALARRLADADASAADILAWTRRFVSNKAKAAENARVAGDLLEASELAKALDPAVDEADRARLRTTADAATNADRSAEVIERQRRLRTFASTRMRSKTECDEAAEFLRKTIKDFPDRRGVSDRARATLRWVARQAEVLK